MYWLLVMQEYIINFFDVVFSKIKKIFGLATARWIAEKQPRGWNIFMDIRPYRVMINLIDPDHV